jgi:hypothetical protein
LQNAFPDGLPKNPDGSVDMNSATNTLVKKGGAEYATPLLQMLMQQGIGAGQSANLQRIDAGVTGGGNQPPAAKAGNFSAAGPANITGGQPQQPQLSSVGADNQGSDTLRSVATEAFGGKDVSPLIPRFAQALGVSPDAPLTPQQVQQARTIMSRTAQNRGQTQDDSGPGTQPAPASGASGSPAPTGQPVTQGQPQEVSPTGIPTQQGQSQGGVGATGIPLSQYPVMINRLHQAATQARAAGAGIAAYNPATASQYEKQADSYDARAKQMQEEAQKISEPTILQKDYNSGVTAKTEIQKADIERGTKALGGIQAQASQYERDQKQYLDLSRSILNDPKMYTGIGADAVLNFDRIKAVYGDTKAAMLKEALSKVTATSVLSQINTQKDQMQEAGTNAGRIFAQQVALVEKAAPALSNTLAGNRFLVEVARRSGELASEVASQARTYKQAHGYLDTGFDTKISTYLQKNPVFSQNELSHAELLGSPTIPPGLKGGEILNWARDMGLKPGDPMRTSDGKGYKTVPAVAQ